MDQPTSNRGISLDQVEQVESHLDHEELNECIFLLYDDVGVALEELDRSRSSKDGHVLVKWVNYSVSQDEVWEDKFLETLLIIKHYRCIRLLGKNRAELESIFLPKSFKQHHVNLGRKMLYLMVDDLTEEHWEKIKKLMVDNASCEVPSKYQNTPQGFLLFLLSENLLLIESKEKIVDFHCFHNWLEGSDWAKTWQQAITFINKQGNGCDTKNGSSVLQKGSTNSDSRFHLGPSKQGTILIFNEENYPKKFRHGSQIDCTRLENTFHLLNFVVHTFKDTPGEQICKKIEHYGKIFSSECKKSKEIRCFAVAILAHGSEDGVECADGKTIPWIHIKSVLRTSNMIGLPRFFLTQVCKGSLLAIHTPTGIEVVSDGFGADFGNVDDLFEFHSCMSGFKAYRNEIFGSFFIISFCRHVLEFGGKKDIEYIAKTVRKELKGLKVKYKNVYVSMIPKFVPNSDKYLYFTVPDHNLKKRDELVRMLEDEFQNRQLSSRRQKDIENQGEDSQSGDDNDDTNNQQYQNNFQSAEEKISRAFDSGGNDSHDEDEDTV